MNADSEIKKSATTLQKKRIFVVDDHSLLRAGLKHLINGEPDLEICGESDNGKDAIAVMAGIKPDAAVVDISLPGDNGIECVKSFRSHFPELKMLVLSVYDEAFYAERALRAGAKGYIMKKEEGHLVLEALRKVLRDEVYLSPKAVTKLLGGMVAASCSPERGLKTLTDRELEILHLMGEGMTSSEISEKLSVSLKTVESHRGNMRKKLKLSNAGELVRFALATISMPDN